MVDKMAQRRHFDKKGNQYPEKDLLHPRRHVILETNALIAQIPKKVRSVVDFGCGTGRLTIPLLKKGYSVFAVDTSTESLKTLRKHAKKWGLDGKLTCGDCIPPHAECIVGTDVLHHVPLVSTLRIFFNSLTENGCIIFSEPNLFNPSWIIFHMLGGRLGTERGLIQMREKKIVADGQRQGFRQIRVDGLGIAPLPLLNHFSKLQNMNISLSEHWPMRVIAYRLLIKMKK